MGLLNIFTKKKSVNPQNFSNCHNDNFEDAFRMQHDMRIIAGDAILVIVDDIYKEGLGAYFDYRTRNHVSEQEWYDEMQNLIKDNFEEACNTFISKMEGGVYFLNITDGLNRAAYDMDSTFYLHLCEEEIDVFYPIMRNFIETHSDGKQIGITACFGGGTCIGMSYLVNKLKQDGFQCLVVGTTLPFLSRNKDSLSERLGTRIENFEHFDCSSYIDKSTTILEFYEKDIETIFDAMKARIMGNITKNTNKSILR